LHDSNVVRVKEKAAPLPPICVGAGKENDVAAAADVNVAISTSDAAVTVKVTSDNASAGSSSLPEVQQCSSSQDDELAGPGSHAAGTAAMPRWEPPAPPQSTFGISSAYFSDVPVAKKPDATDDSRIEDEDGCEVEFLGEMDTIKLDPTPVQVVTSARRKEHARAMMSGSGSGSPKKERAPVQSGGCWDLGAELAVDQKPPVGGARGLLMNRRNNVQKVNIAA
jgi:hypothetical protein